MIRSVADALSLTLPKGRTRSKRRQWRRPPRRFWYWLAWAVYAGCVVIVDVLQDRWAHAVLTASLVGLYWRWAMRTRDGRPLDGLAISVGFVAGYIGCLVFLDVLGIA